MSSKFTEGLENVMRLANEEAHRLNHQYIGTEHMLLALVKEEQGIVIRVLNGSNVDSNQVRQGVMDMVSPGPDGELSELLPQTPRAKKVIEFAIEEARNLNHDYVGIEHLLLALLREKEGAAAQVLMDLGLNLGGLRAAVLVEVDRGSTDDGIPDFLRPVIDDICALAAQTNVRKGLEAALAAMEALSAHDKATRLLRPEPEAAPE